MDNARSAATGTAAAAAGAGSARQVCRPLLLLCCSHTHPRTLRLVRFFFVAGVVFVDNFLVSLTLYLPSGGAFLPAMGNAPHVLHF